MKGIDHPRNDESLNKSGNESIRDVIAQVSESRRHFLKSAFSATALASVGGVTLGGFMQSVEAAPIPPSVGFAGYGFDSVPPNFRNAVTGLADTDLVSVPKGYKATILSAWGDPIMPGAQDWDVSATQDAAAQEKQVGMHHDGMHFFPFPTRGGGRLGVSSDRGLLCVNHEYTHENVLHGAEGLTGGVGVTIQKVRKSQAAHGVSVQEIVKTGNGWRVQRGSPFGRRITVNTPMRISGPAAGDDLLKSKRFQITPNGSVDTGNTNDGFTVFGTANNCAHGYTPWGTYLTCEENWNGYFGSTSPATNPNFVPTGVPANPFVPNTATEAGRDYNRYGISINGFGYRWHTVDPRFDVLANPKEPNLFGWVVEIDPFDPASVPVKRTALGRFKHESAQEAVDAQNRVAFYQACDEVNEYLYKFVCARPFTPNNRAANRDMLDHGTLYVAKFNADGTGEWLALVHGQNGLTTENGFRNQADVLIRTRQAADRVGATMMDRPEWCAYRPRVLGYEEIEVYCTLTNNSRRGTSPASSNNPNGLTGASAARPPVDSANPRASNSFGHIIRWREDGRSVAATTFKWDLFVECGDPTLPQANLQGNIVGDAYGAPDGLWFDYFGRLWIQTDQSLGGASPYQNVGTNQMLCADPNTKATRRFLTAPAGCEVTGVIVTPDHRTMFVNVQHPGEGSPAENPTQFSNWPHTQGYGPSGRPRSATVVITKDDGGIIGT
jgi:uncharacterized protein